MRQIQQVKKVKNIKMKKIVTVVLAGLITTAASAQDNYPRIGGEVFRAVAVIFVLLSFTAFQVLPAGALS